MVAISLSGNSRLFHERDTGSMNGCLAHDQVLDIVFRDHDVLSDIGLLCPGNDKFREMRTCPDSGVFDPGIDPPGPVDDAR